MPKDISGHKRDTPAVAVDPADRLVDLLSTFSTLRSDGRVLVDQIRGSIHEMRQLRGQLRGNRTHCPALAATAPTAPTTIAPSFRPGTG
jgi:hypothetical protein